MKTSLLISLFIAFQAVAQTPPVILTLPAPPHFISNPQIQQCVAALPTIGWMGFDHTWLATQDQSFGMPYSFTRDAIQGGYASIRTPDPSLPNLASQPTCQPIYQPENIPTEKFTKDFLCLVSKLSDSNEELWPLWQPVFVYDWAASNCHSSVRFVLDCAGGAMSFNPNGGLGSHYSANGKLNVWLKNLNNPFDPKATSLQKLFQKFLLDLEEIEKNQGNIEKFLQERGPPILLESQNLSKSLDKARDLNRVGLYRRLQKFNFNFKRITTLLQSSVTPEALQKMKTLNELFRQPDTVTKTFQQICEQAQKECL